MKTKEKARASKARYDKRRGGPISVRLNDAEEAWLHERALPEEGCSTTLKRLAGMPGTGCRYGDPLCPCQDGDPCHYEWSGDMPPMRPPRKPA